MSVKVNAVKTASYMMLITLIGKVLGLFREQLLAHNFAVGMEASAFMTASQIPRIFFDAVFASAISASFIPIFNDVLEKKGKKEAFELSNNFITIIGIITVLMTIVSTFFAADLTQMFADGFDSETAELCTYLLRFMLPTIVFTGIAFSFVGILQSMGEFTIPAAMSIVSNGIVIVYFLFLNKSFGIFGLTIAFLIGWAMQAIIQIPSLLKRGYVYRPYINIKNDDIRKIFSLMLPTMVSTWIQPINLSINLKYASRLYNGSGVAAINFANTLYTIIVGVFVLSIANVIFPELSRLNTNNKDEEFGFVINKTIRALSFLLIPMTVGLMALSGPLIKLIYEWGEFDSFSTSITSRALLFFSIGMYGFGIQAILSRAFYANKDGRTPLISGLVSIIVNLTACIFLVDKFDVAGLAFASSLSTLVSALILIVPMKKKNKHIIDKNFGVDFLKIIGSSLVMMAAVYVLKNFIQQNLYDSLLSRLIIILIPTSIGVLIYMTIAHALKIEEANMVISYFVKILNKIKNILIKKH